MRRGLLRRVRHHRMRAGRVRQYAGQRPFRRRLSPPEALARELPEGERGLILIKGPTVFGGYLGGSPDPFVAFRGERWYNSGDLGFMKEGRLHISGRLKRFVKIGGEMISLPAIEDALKEKFPDTKKGPMIAVVEVEAEGRNEIVLASAVDVKLEDVNEIIFAAGFTAIARIRRMVIFEKIPQLGTGKADIQQIVKSARSSSPEGSGSTSR